MADRTIKMYGKVYGSSTSTMTVHWAGQEVFSGTVPTVDAPVDHGVNFDVMDQLATWTIDTSVSGPTTLTITIDNNPMIFHVLHANYFGPEFQKVGNSNVQITSTENRWSDITGTSTLASTGYNNVTVDGISIVHTPLSEIESLGKLNWYLNAGSTLICDVNVQPSIL